MKKVLLFAMLFMAVLFVNCDGNSPVNQNSNGIGVFSVAPTKRVTFSPGNLQYHPKNDKWQFAIKQTEYIGSSNFNLSSDYDGWVDLFGWSGSTASIKFGVGISGDENDYSGSFVDWGTNKIGNHAPNTWRTLTMDEWTYLLKVRDKAEILCGVAMVYGMTGLILLPDNWTWPSGVEFKYGFHDKRGVKYYGEYQSFSAEEWAIFEKNGAVFLPAAGYREIEEGEMNIWGVQEDGLYWSASVYKESKIWVEGILFDSREYELTDFARYYGLSVRLVKDLQ